MVPTKLHPEISAAIAAGIMSAGARGLPVPTHAEIIAAANLALSQAISRQTEPCPPGVIPNAFGNCAQEPPPTEFALLGLAVPILIGGWYIRKIINYKHPPPPPSPKPEWWGSTEDETKHTRSHRSKYGQPPDMSDNPERPWHEVLEISSDASADDVKKAYRKLARRRHPDHSRNPRAQEIMNELNQAYSRAKQEKNIR